MDRQRQRGEDRLGPEAEERRAGGGPPRDDRLRGADSGGSLHGGLTIGGAARAVKPAPTPGTGLAARRRSVYHAAYEPERGEHTNPEDTDGT